MELSFLLGEDEPESIVDDPITPATEDTTLPAPNVNNEPPKPSIDISIVVKQIETLEAVTAELRKIDYIETFHRSILEKKGINRQDIQQLEEVVPGAAKPYAINSFTQFDSKVNYQVILTKLEKWLSPEYPVLKTAMKDLIDELKTLPNTLTKESLQLYFTYVNDMLVDINNHPLVKGNRKLDNLVFKTTSGFVNLLDTTIGNINGITFIYPPYPESSTPRERIEALKKFAYPLGDWLNKGYVIAFLSELMIPNMDPVITVPTYRDTITIFSGQYITTKLKQLEDEIYTVYQQLEKDTLTLEEAQVMLEKMQSFKNTIDILTAMEHLVPVLKESWDVIMFIG